MTRPNYLYDPLPSWHDLLWWEKLIVGTVVSLAAMVMFGGLFLFCGLMMEGQARYYDEISSCRKRAETPAEYHDCR